MRYGLRAALSRGLIGCALLVAGITGLLADPTVGAARVSRGTCVPFTGSTTPSQVALDATSKGLVFVDDGVRTYGVGGATVGDIRDALDTCAPGAQARSGEFLAYTSYAVNWRYELERTGTECQLNNVAVGLHVGQLMPRLVDSSTSDVSAKWSAFEAGLQSHEDGHKAIDIAAANDLLRNLENLHGSCMDLTVRANAVTARAVLGFVTANKDHDAQTDHGLSQGAVW